MNDNEENLKQKVTTLENQLQKAEDITRQLTGEVDYLKEINALLRNEKISSQ